MDAGPTSVLRADPNLAPLPPFALLLALDEVPPVIVARALDAVFPVNPPSLWPPSGSLL